MFRNTPSPSYSSSNNYYNSVRSSSRSPDYYPSRSANNEQQYDPDLKIGDRVIIRSSVADSKTGILQFVGKVDFAEGIWAGVELFYPQGRNDGTVLGVEYFRCKHPYGIFVPLHKIDWSPVNSMGDSWKAASMHGDGHGSHTHGPGGECQIHDRVLWNSEAVMGTRVTGVRNPAL